MPVKIQAKKKSDREQSQKQSQETYTTLHGNHEQTEVTDQITSTENDTQSHSAQTQGNVDLGNMLMQMTQLMNQQGEMMKMMDERMKKLEEQSKPVEKETAKEPEVVVPLNEDNVASYNRETEEGYAEVLNKVWKIMYITAEAPMTRGMPDAAPMMETVNERRRVGNMIVSDTKYFNSEEEAKAYIENLRKKGTILPGAKIISCYI